jgi:AhpC/TSA family
MRKPARPVRESIRNVGWTDSIATRWHSVAAGAILACCLPSSANSRGGIRQPATSESSPPRELNGIDLDGKLRRLGHGRNEAVVAIVFLSTECPISNGYIPVLNRLVNRYSRQGVEFYGVISDSTVTRAAAVAHRKKYDPRFPVLFDASAELRKALRPTHVPQAFVLDREGRTVYSGLIDDQYAEIGKKRLVVRQRYLSNAIAAAVAGRAVRVALTEPIGCMIEETPGKTRPGSVTWCRDIAPIVLANCAGCHRPGETAPFPLLTYHDVAKRSQQIVHVIRKHLMPPWKAVHDFGRFQNERRLSDREIGLIATWSATGKPKGDVENLPPQPTFASGWWLGKPDLIVKMPQAFQIPASGNDIYRHFVISLGMRKDRLVAAMDFRPGNPRVVHHAVVYFDNTGTARRLEAQGGGNGYTSFGGPGFVPAACLGNWTPGCTPHRLPLGAGQAMPRRSDLVLQVHYQCSGKPEADQSEVAIYFCRKRARQVVGSFHVLNGKLHIPAGAARFRHQASYTLLTDVILLDAAPHMHLLGREMKVTATLPNGTVQPLVWVKDWDFHWQGAYTFLKPLSLPRGTRIDVDAYLDNSAGNPLNPSSPPRAVEWGEQTDDEMVVCEFRFTTRTRLEFLIAKRHYQRTMYQELFQYYRKRYGQRNSPAR